MSYAANQSFAPARRPSRLAVPRERAFRSAKRHSALVRLFKVVFPLAALGVSGAAYVLPALLSLAGPAGKTKVDSVEVSIGSLKMVHPRWSGEHPEHGHYDVRAESATQNVKSTDVIALDKITAEVISPAKETTTLTAPDGVLRSKEELLLLQNGAMITGTNGIWARFRTAEVAFKGRVVTTHDPVELRWRQSTITADSASLFVPDSRVVFTGHVHMHLVRVSSAGAPADEQKTDRTSHQSPVLAHSNQAGSMSTAPAAGQ